MEALVHHISRFCDGFYDSLRWGKSLTESRTLRRVAQRVMPLHLMSFILAILFEVVTPLHAWVWRWGWDIPIYFITMAIHLRYGAKIRRQSTRDFAPKIGELVFGMILSIVFYLQCVVLQVTAYVFLSRAWAMPFIHLLGVVHVSLSTSWAALDHRFVLKKHDLFRRVRFLEQNWDYALGYGLIAALFYHFGPRYLASSVWQSLTFMLTLHTFRLRPDRLLKRRALAGTSYRASPIRIFWFSEKVTILIVHECI